VSSRGEPDVETEEAEAIAMVPVLIVVVAVVGCALYLGVELLLDNGWRWFLKRIGIRN
jgi:hypothetical protein